MYNNLFQRGFIGKVELKNRVVMPPMCPRLSDHMHFVTPDTIAYFEERAKGGVGLIIPESTAVDVETGCVSQLANAMHDDRGIQWTQRLADALHQYGTKYFVQLQQAGPQAHAANNEGRQPIGPSPVANPAVGEVPREISKEEIAKVVQDFVDAAQRCKQAGVDGVEILSGHGYLLNCFMSPKYNKRSDEYGGSIENRARFTNEIIAGIKKQCGRDFPIIIRMSVDEFVEGGYGVEEGVKFAQIFEKAGADAIHASAANYESNAQLDETVIFPQGWRVYLAEAVKKAVNIPVIAVGVIREPDFADGVIAEGKTDFVAIGRGQIADPEWCNKAKEGRADEIRRCISCRYCIENVLMNNTRITCAMNPRAGAERYFPKEMKKDGNGRKVIVVGGGCAGMQAAITLKQRDFDVTLYDKASRLGGQIVLAERPLHKEKIMWSVEYWESEMKRVGVEVKLNTEVSKEMLQKENPYAVFVATGSKPFIIPVEGVDKAHVFTAEDVLDTTPNWKGKKVIVVGGGMTGCETAELIESWGNEVSVVEMQKEVCFGLYPSTRRETIQALDEAGVKMLVNSQLCEIKDNAIDVKSTITGEITSLDADYVVLSLGNRPENVLYNDIADDMNAVLIGDALQVGRIGTATKEAFLRAYGLQ